MNERKKIIYITILSTNSDSYFSMNKILYKLKCPHHKLWLNSARARTDFCCCCLKFVCVWVGVYAILYMGDHATLRFRLAEREKPLRSKEIATKCTSEAAINSVTCIHLTFVFIQTHRWSVIP